MKDMTEGNEAFTRRSFLARLAAGTSAAALLGLEVQPASILAANDPEKGLALDPNFIAGTLVAREADRVDVYAEGYGPPVPVRLTGRTQVCCRQDYCDSRPDALRIGDRVDVSTYSGPKGERVARWLNANFIAGWGLVGAIEENVVYTEPVPEMPRPKRRMTIMPYTVIITKSAEGKGRIDLLNVGDMLHFTALADSPDRGVLDVIAGWLQVVYPVPETA